MSRRMSSFLTLPLARLRGTAGVACVSAGVLLAAAGTIYGLSMRPGYAIGVLPFKGQDDYMCGGSAADTKVSRLPALPVAANDDGFVEDFTGNTGLDRFRRGVFHRNIGAQELGQKPVIWGDNNTGHGGSWTADHDLSCGPPETQRTLSSVKQASGKSHGWVPTVDFNLQGIFYLCRDHMMSSMGDVDGYSIAWFSPKRQFRRETHKRVSWDVNVTDLGGRQWWEVSVVPVGAKFLATAGWLKDTAHVSEYDRRTVVVGSGPAAGTVNITTEDKNRYDGWRSLCGKSGLDPVGCASKMVRRPFSVTDNGNGTLTVNYGGLFTKSVPGRFPDEFEVYFQDHNYTPDKDGMPAGHTWHWDSVRVE